MLGTPEIDRGLTFRLKVGNYPLQSTTSFSPFAFYFILSFLVVLDGAPYHPIQQERNRR